MRCTANTRRVKGLENRSVQCHLKRGHAGLHCVFIEGPAGSVTIQEFPDSWAFFPEYTVSHKLGKDTPSPEYRG